MFRPRALATVAVFLATVATCFAAPPEAPATLAAPRDKVREFVVKCPKDQKLCFRLVGDKCLFRDVKTLDDGSVVFWIASETGGPSNIVWWFKGSEDSAVTAVNEGAAPPVEPTDPVTPPTDETSTSDRKFFVDLKAAYKNDTDAKKAAHVSWLAQVYQGAADVTARDPTVKTYKDLVDDMIKVSRLKIPADAIPLVRGQLARRLDASLGTDLSRPVGDRDALSRELATVARALLAAPK